MTTQDTQSQTTQQQPTIITQPALHLVGLTYSGPFNTLSQGVPRIANELNARRPEIPHAVDPAIRHELSQEDPNGTYTVRACLLVDTLPATMPADMIGFTVPEQTYVRITHQGPLQEVPNTYVRAFHWIADNNLKRRSPITCHSIEIYSNETNNLLEILIPIETPAP